MNLQQLQYFMITAQVQNISKAAAHLHISQSALSKQIAKLEAELGFSLFDRNGKKIILNKAGRRFMLSGNAIIKELSAAQNDIELLYSANDHRVRIGAFCLPDSITGCMAAFKEEHPETAFSVYNRIEYDEHFNINEYDALICPDEPQYENLSGFPLFTEKYYFAVKSTDPFAKETVFTEEILKKRSVIFLQGNEMIQEFPYRILTSAGTKILHAMFCDTKEAHYRMVSSGIACGFVSASEAFAYQNDPDITLLHVMDNRFSRPVKICFLRQKHLTPLAAAFRRFTMEYLHLN